MDPMTLFLEQLGAFLTGIATFVQDFLLQILAAFLF